MSAIEPRTIPGVLRAAAARDPDHTAIEDGAVVLTYRELSEAVSSATAAFIASGVDLGDRVAIWAPNLHEWIVLCIGAQAAGAVVVPINTRFKGAEASYVLAASRARILVTMDEFLGSRPLDMLRTSSGGPAGGRPVRDLPGLEKVVTLRCAGPDATTYEAFLDSGKVTDRRALDERERAVLPDDPSDILFTSGTTGRPKGVITTHAQNVAVFSAWADVVGLRSTDRYLVVNPFFHSFGYKAGFLASLLRGATILPEAVFDPGRVLSRIARDRVTVLPGPPTLYQSFLAHPDLPSFDLSGLRLAVTGAATIPVELIRRMKDELGFETVITGYGLTESCGVVTMCRYDDDLVTIATTCGRPIPGVEVRIDREPGAPAEPGIEGEVMVRGYNVMKGYFENPEATREVVDSDGWLRTGDVGTLDSASNLKITDRKKDVFIVGGFNCYPAEIEAIMRRNPLVADVAVVGVPDTRLGEIGVAFVVPSSGSELSEGAFLSWCKANMANYKVPRAAHLVDALPVNASGKVMKYELRERARVARAP